LQCGVRVKDAEKFAEIVGGVEQDWKDSGVFKTVICEEADDGAGQELTDAAKEGLVFYGYHTAGNDYPARKFASNGDGELYFVNCISGNGAVTPVLELAENGEMLSPGALAGTRAALEVYRTVQAMAFPKKSEGGDEDFGEKIFGLVAQGLSNAEIVEYLDGDTAMEDLVALARKHFHYHDADVTNQAPDTDAVLIELSGFKISISRDEAGVVYVGVSDPDGNEQRMVLGCAGWSLGDRQSTST
jgi:hypothetical protein